MSILMKRKSTRKYTDKLVEQEKVIEMLKAAMQAPSSKNQQPWKFIVVNDRLVLDDLALTSPSANMLSQATLAIVPIMLEAEKAPHFAVQDLSAATENILLEATNQGLGSVWIGIYPLEDRVSHVKKVLSIPENINPFSIISIGYPLDDSIKKERYTEERVFYNKWGE